MNSDFKPYAEGNYLILNVAWLYTAGDVCVGCVKAKKKDNVPMYYIGLGGGEDWREDVRKIVSLGAKYPDLNFLKDM